MKNKHIYLLLSICLLVFKAHSEERPYVVGSILGGLGNQMFQVATTCAVAWDNGADPYFPDLIPVRPHSEVYQHVLFRCLLNPPKPDISCTWSTPAYGYKPIPFKNGMRIAGYSQNEKYFSRYRDRLLKLFAPKRADLHYIQRKYRKILAHPNSVGIHVRHYYAEKPHEPSFRQYDEEYYGRAMSLFPNDALFVVCSDNIQFAKSVIPTNGKNVIFISSEPLYVDFFILTLCKHNIIANSTFSWWAAWLNQNPGKIIVRPNEWFGGQPDIGGPDGWIKIKAKSLQEKL